MRRGSPWVQRRLLSIWLGENVAAGQDDPRTVFYQAMAPAKPVVEGLMLPEGYEKELEVPPTRKIMGITLDSIGTNWSMRDKGFWMIQSQRPFWAPLLVVHYGQPGGTYWRIVIFDRDGRKLIDRRPRWRFIPWVAQLEEHGALKGTVLHLGNEFWRLDKEKTNAKDKGERDRATANISKFLWPVPKAENRGELLRRFLSVRDDNPLKPRKMRDSFEHFDERLDSWIASGKGDHFGRIYGPTNLLKFKPEDNARIYDPVARSLALFGEKYDMRAVVNEIERLHGIFKEEPDAQTMKDLLSGA